MKKTAFKKTEVITGRICDVCNLEATIEDPEFDDFWSIDQTCGYHSIFGDGVHISLDICQHCLKDKLGQWIKIGASKW